MTTIIAPVGGNQLNFLQLCQKLRLECGIAGSGPVTTIAQSGELGRLVNYINEAWIDIQATHQDWEFLRKSASFVTVAGQATYSTSQIGLSDFGQWCRDTFRNYVTSAGTASEVFMDCIDYDVWLNYYQYGAIRSVQTRPIQMSISPAKAICLGPPPTAGYTVTGDYFQVPLEMALDVDVPALPLQYQMAIIYRAKMFYGAYESAGEVYDEGAREFKKVMSRMEKDRLPEMYFAGPLA